MHSHSDLSYILEAKHEITYEQNGKKFTNSGLTNFIRLYGFIPSGVRVIKRRKRSPKTKKDIVKVTKKTPNKKKI